MEETSAEALVDIITPFCLEFYYERKKTSVITVITCNRFSAMDVLT